MIRTALLTVLLGARIAPGQVPPDEEIRKILAERIDTYHQSVGIVVGVIEPQGRRIVSYGALAKGDTRPLDGDTLYEIGSITKVFTSLLLAGMVERGEVALTDPVAKYLPDGVKVPERGGKQITLVDLSTHTSGLPRMPDNFKPKDQGNPYVDYSVENLYEFLSGYKLKRGIGERFEYSNLGVALLGQVLARRDGMDYEAFVQARILGPLAMTSTGISLTPEMRARLAVGHGYFYKVEPVSNWDLGTFAGAGALRSTAKDMLTFLAANLGYTDTPMASSMAAMLKVRRRIADLGPFGFLAHERIALGWIVAPRNGTEIIFHNGGTGGYRSFIGYDAKARVGVVVLSNSGSGEGMDDIGFHLLNPKSPLLRGVKLRVLKDRPEITIDPKLLDAYVGRYLFPDKDIWTFRREGNCIVMSHLTEADAELCPENERSFFFKVADAQVAFEVDRQGRATGLVVHSAGAKDQRAKRLP